VILVLAIVLFGAGKIGEVGGALGRSIREFRHAANDEEPQRETPRPAAGTAGKLCPKCGAAASESDRFCSACGASLAPDRSPDPSDTNAKLP
jgi:sec-independent protein translocase protein TatA